MNDSPALEQQARRAAKKAGLQARKSRTRKYLSIDDYGGFMVVDPYYNVVIAGSRFDMSAQELIDYCTDLS